MAKRKQGQQNAPVLDVRPEPADSIRPNSYNPNRQNGREFLLLLQSLDEDGMTQSPVVNRESREIIDGEHRWRGWIVLHYLKKAGKWPSKDRKYLLELRDRTDELLKEMPGFTVPVVLTDMTAEQMRIATLRHNRARGTEDLEATAVVMQELRELGALEEAKGALLLDDTDVQRMIDKATADEALANEQFTDSWVPAADSEGDGGKAKTVSMTDSWRQAVPEEKTNLYRVTLTFYGEESELVKAIIGPAPAQRLLELCRKEAQKAG